MDKKTDSEMNNPDNISYFFDADPGSGMDKHPGSAGLFQLSEVYAIRLLINSSGENQCCGSGFQCFFDPWIRDGKKSGSGMNIPDHFSESLETFFRAKNT
jgi:hypothetical protein